MFARWGLEAAESEQGAAALAASAAAAAPLHLLVSPATIPAGGSITISARSSPCLSRDQIMLISTAFPGFAFGQGAVYGGVRAGGAFRVRARIRADLRPGRYSISARCGGGNLGVSANLTVTRPTVE